MTQPNTHVEVLTSRERLSSLISALSVDVLKEFIHRCVDEICGRKGPAAENYCSSCSWTHMQFQEAVASSKAFLVDCVVHSHNREKVEETMSLLNEHQISAIINCITVRSEELQKSLLNNYQNHIDVSLKDHDWKVKWVMGSSSLASLQETLLELDLITVQNTCADKLNSSVKETSRIRLELTRDNVTSLISVLEKAQEST